MSDRRLLVISLLGATLAAPLSAQAVFIGNSQGGTDFPQGALSFADVVDSYSPGMVGGNPAAPYRGAENATGTPDFAGATSCASQAGCSFVSLGHGGSLTLQFTDNRLTGSGTNAPDLWVFEVGPDIEDTFVEISTDGAAFIPVGKVFGTTAGIDIDAFGFGTGDEFAFIRLIDDRNEGASSGTTVGADIDAVGAISSVATALPEPGGLALAGLGLTMLGVFGRRRGSPSHPGTD